MQVILTIDVPKVGKKGQLCDVSDGYGRNFLVARGYAKVASEGRLRAVEKEKAEHDALLEREYNTAVELGKFLESKPLVLEAKTGSEGRLFGAVTSQDIVAALQKQFGKTIDKKVVKLDSPIKSIGSFKVQVKLHTKVKASLDVQVKELN